MGEQHHHELLRRCRHPVERHHLTDRELLIGTLLLLEVHMEASATQYAELQASVDALSQSVEAAKGRISEDVQALSQHVTDLEAQIAANQPPDLSPLKGQLDSLRASVDAIDPVPPAAPPADPGAPPAEAPPAGDAPPAGEPPAEPPPPDPAPA